MDFEIDRIRELGFDSRTVVVYRGDTVPVFAASGRYADVLPVSRFLTGVRGKTGPGVLTKSAERLLRDLAVAATTRAAPSQRLQTMPCEIVDSGEHVSLNDSDARQSYFVTSSNAAAFVSYVNEFPDSLMRWNAIGFNHIPILHRSAFEMFDMNNHPIQIHTLCRRAMQMALTRISVLPAWDSRLRWRAR